MPQEMRVVRCYKCETFQVDIEKISNKWKCKVCGEKQSLKKIYDIGSGKECRKIVQELNGLRLKNDNSLSEKLDELPNCIDFIPKNPDNVIEKSSNVPSCSKWSEFTDKKEDISSTDNETELQISPPRKKAKYHSTDMKKTKNSATSNIESQSCIIPRLDSSKKAQKRPLDSYEDEISSYPPAKCNKINDHSSHLHLNDKVTKKSQNKWSEFIDDNILPVTQEDETEPYIDTVEDTKLNIEKVEKVRYQTKRDGNSVNIMESESPKKSETPDNLNWDFHTEWDSFSEPSQTSFNEGEINDIIDDQFEEFEKKPEEEEIDDASTHKPNKTEMFGTVENTSELDVILTL